MRSYTVIGMGAIGGYYGARLQARRGPTVRFVVRRNVEPLRATACASTRPLGDAAPRRGRPRRPRRRAAQRRRRGGGQDHRHRDGDPGGGRGWLRRARPDAIVVVMQNGLGVEAPFARAAPGATVLGAMCFMCSNQLAPGHIVHLDQGAVTVGEHRADGAPAGVDPGGRGDLRRSAGRGGGRHCRARPGDRSLAQAGLEHPVQRLVGGARRRHRRDVGRPGHPGAGPGP